MGEAMPTTFQDREQAFEAKFAHDEEFRFLAGARGDRLFAQWAIKRMRLKVERADAVVNAVLAIPNGPGHDEALIKHISEALSARGAWLPEQNLWATLKDCRQEAQRQLTETPPDRSEVV